MHRRQKPVQRLRRPVLRRAGCDICYAARFATPLHLNLMETPFNDRGVSVTRNALSSAGQVFPLRDIVGVQVVTVQKNRVLPLTISLLGLVGAILGGIFRSPVGIVCGVMLIVVGWLTWVTQDITHRLMVQTANGEREALMSTDREFVERVGAAVQEAKAAGAQNT
jgi:hypothetical protein